MASQSSDGHLQPRRDIHLVRQLCAAAKERLQFVEKPRLRSLRKLFGQVGERTAYKRTRPTLLIRLLLVRKGYGFARVIRFRGFDLGVEEDELAIAATLLGMFTVPNVRQVMLD